MMRGAGDEHDGRRGRQVPMPAHPPPLGGGRRRLGVTLNRPQVNPVLPAPRFVVPAGDSGGGGVRRLIAAEREERHWLCSCSGQHVCIHRGQRPCVAQDRAGCHAGGRVYGQGNLPVADD